MRHHCLNNQARITYGGVAVILAILLAQGLAMNVAAPAQTIDGFGVSGSIFGANGTAPATGGGAWSDAQYKLFFDPVSGLGLNIFRIGIANTDDGTTTPWMDNNPGFNDQMTGCLKAKKWNSSLIVYGTPWSAPNACKSGGVQNGGTFVTTCNASWSAAIGAAVDEANNVGCHLTYVSAQNEPDNNVNSGGAMTFTAAALTTWVKVLGPALAAHANPPTIMCCESAQWINAYTISGTGYIDNCAGDPTCLAQCGVWGVHAYGTPFGTVQAVGALHSLHLWMTEASWLDNASNLAMTGAGGGLATAVVMHNSIVTGGASAYVPWWGVSGNTTQDDGLIEFGGNISKRYYVLGQYSKFVRPGMQLIPLTGTPPSSVLASSYRDPTSNNVAIVAINSNVTTASLTITMDAASKVQVVTPWLTDASNNIVQQTPVIVSGHAFSYTLPASSVVTFAGAGT